MTPASSAIFILVVFFAALCTCLEDGDRRNPLSKDFCDNLYVSHALTFCRRWIVCEKVQLVSKTATTGNARSSKWIWKLANSQLLLRSFPVDTQKRNYIRTVPNAIFSFVSPTPFNTPVQLAAYSSAVLTNILDLDVPSILNSSAWLDIISGRSIIPGSKPIAHRYGGHQFGVWAGQLGDGRAVMLGEYVNRRDERWELQLKGSGKTPYSRQGDGRAVLRSSVREFLCSEAMHHLGIPTSRAASLVVSKDKILRDQFYNGNIKAEKCAIVLRLAKSWFRIGSLEVLSANEEFDLLRELVDFIIKHYFEDIDEQDPDKYLSFFSEVVNNTATLMAQWMSFGFAHGVMNTDNFSILSITIDYGPFGFLDAYNPKFVPNTSDDEERYSFEKQPDVGQFNLDKLRRAMIPLLTSRQESYIQYILDGYVEVYKSQYMKILRNKLGLNGNDGKDEYLVALLLKIMEDEKSDFTMTFRHLSEIQLTDLKQYDIKYEFWTLRDLIQSKYFKKWISLYAARLQGPGFDDSIRQTNMMNSNPRYVLRNWIAQMAIENAEKGDYSVIELVSRVLKEPFTQQADAEMAGFANRPPSWSKKLKVSCSS